MADAAPLLDVDGIETCYGLSQVLFGLSLSVRSGEMVALMGRNGMGKTTTIRSIMGLTPARAGAIRFGGHEVRQLPSFRIAQLGIGLVPEGRQIFPNLTVRENLVAASGNRLGSPDPWTIEKIHALFPRLAERGANMGGTLSGGEQQMLAIGRALMTNPRLLDPGRGHRRSRAADPRRNLELPVDAEGARPVGAGDRQERRKPHPHRRPPLHHRARPGGVERDVGAVDRGAGAAAPVSGDLNIVAGERSRFARGNGKALFPAWTRFRQYPCLAYAAGAFMIVEPILR